MMRRKSQIKQPRFRARHGFIEDWPASYLYVKDRMAGRRNVYTVWRLALTGAERAGRVIGRELPISGVRRVIQRDRKAAP